MLHLSLKFILTFKNVFKAIVLVNWVLFLYYLQQMVLLIYDIFNFLCLEIFVELISIHPILNSSIGREASAAFDRDLGLITFGIILIIIYSLFVMGELNTYRSRMLIGIAGVISVGFAYVEAMALGSFAGLKGNGVVSVVPFLMIGIGVDDMFVLITALKQAPRDSSRQEMMEYMMKHAGVSITITSLTNFGAFAIGSITTIPAIHNFCLYAALGMLFDYFNQITFFAALLAYDIRRSERPLGDFCGLVCCKPDSAACCQGKYIVDESGNPQEPLSQRFIYKVYGKYLMKTPVRVVVCVVFLALLGVNIYGATQLEQEFDYEWFANEDFRVYESMEIRDEYFDTSGLSVGFYSLYSDFETAETQEKLETLAEKIDECSGCDETWIVPGSTDSWYANFKNWVNNGNCVTSGGTVSLSGGYVPAGDFHDCLEQFEASDDGSKYAADLAWSDGVLIGSRIQADMVDLETTGDTIQVLSDTRDIAKYGPDDTYAYNGAYPWYEHNAVFARETTIQIASALTLVFVIILITNADVLAGLLVLVMVGMTVVGQMATVHFWGEQLNIVTMVNTIMAIGISVDYSAHLIHTFKSLEGENKKKKTRRALRVIGVNIFNGGFSTLLAILPLTGSETYIFRVFFKCWFPIVVYGLGHALILLPVILSVFGVTPFSKPDEKEASQSKTDKPCGSSQVQPGEDDGLKDQN